VALVLAVSRRPGADRGIVEHRHEDLVRWSGLLFGLMMFLFVRCCISGSDRQRQPNRMDGRLPRSVVRRRRLVLAGIAMGGLGGPGKSLIGAGRVLIAITAIFFGVQHFLHPLALPEFRS